MISRLFPILATLAATTAVASGGGEHGTTSAPDFIIHHVGDSEEYEFELPWAGAHNPKLHLGEIFSGLRFEKVPGACALPVPTGFEAFPGLGKWLMNGCYDLRPTKSVLMMWLAAVLLILTTLLYAHRDSSKLVPTGVAANIIEVLVLFVRDELVVKNIGEKESPRYTPLLLTLFFFILFMNWLGLIPNMATATGNIAVTAGMAIIIFVLTQIASIRSAGIGGYLKHLTGGTPVALWPIMIPVETLGLFTKPFALTIRLFANMLAGHMVLFFILGLIFIIHWGAFVLAVPMTMAIYFLELGVGILQAYIFTMLSALYIGLGVAMGHHGHEEHAEHAH